MLAHLHSERFLGHPQGYRFDAEVGVQQVGLDHQTGGSREVPDRLLHITFIHIDHQVVHPDDRQRVETVDRDATRHIVDGALCTWAACTTDVYDLVDHFLAVSLDADCMFQCEAEPGQDEHVGADHCLEGVEVALPHSPELLDQVGTSLHPEE